MRRGEALEGHHPAIVGGQLPLLAKPFGRALVPRVAPPAEKERIVRPAEAARGDIGHHRVRLEVDLAAVLPHEKAEVAVLAEAEQALVKRSQPIEYLPAHEHAVEFHLLARHPDEVMPHVGRPLTREAMPLHEAAAAFPLFQVGISGRHVDLFTLRLANEVHRAHNRGARRLRALDELAEPAWRGYRVVVDEHDVPGLNVGKTEVPRFVRNEVAIDAHEGKSARADLLGQIPADAAGRAPVYVDQAKGFGGIRV